MSLSSSPSSQPEFPAKEIEIQNTLKAFHQEEVDLAHEIRSVHQLCAKIQGTENIDPHLLPQVEVALTSFGVSAEEALSDDELLQMLKKDFSELKKQRVTEGNESTKESIKSRMLELKDKMNLQSLLSSIRTEFGDQIDEDTISVLEKYEALFDPQFITDEKERTAVETLFWKHGAADFSESSFQGFIATVEEQPDSVISQETKQKIREKFASHNDAPKRGTELLKAIHTKDEHGKPLHHSPETAIKLESGVSTYTQADGRTVMSYPSLGNEPAHTRFVNTNESQSGEFIAQQINTNLVRKLVYNQFHGMIGLFGGTESDGVFQAHYGADTMRTAHQFTSALIGKQDAGNILTPSQLNTLKNSLQALTNPLNSNEAEDIQNMEALGILQNGEFNWKQLDTTGRILKENNAFKVHAMSDPSAPYRLLQQSLDTREEAVHAA